MLQFSKYMQVAVCGYRTQPCFGPLGYYETEKFSQSMLWFSYQIVESDQKFNHLVAFLKRHKEDKHLIFFSTCASVDYFSKVLQEWVLFAYYPQFIYVAIGMDLNKHNLCSQNPEEYEDLQHPWQERNKE